MKKTTFRLNKYLAQNGIGARRKIADILKDNQILVNGKRVTEPGIRIDPKSDHILFNGKELPKLETFVYFLLNKPKGVISSVQDEFGRKTVVELIKTKERIYPVGRLDVNTTGALLLTNDGELAYHLTHPSFHIDKTYECIIPSKVRGDQISQLKSGILLKEGRTAPADVQIIEEKNNRTILQLTIHEGRNHQVKRMLSKVRLELVELKRTAIGQLQLKDLPLGSFRVLTEAEVAQLKQ